MQPSKKKCYQLSLEKWHQYVYGRHVVIKTDHKPLESIAKKPLDRAPKRLQGMLLRSLAYDIDIQYTPGHTQHLADMMSRSFLPADLQAHPSEFESVNAVQFLPMRQERYRKSNSRLQRMKPCNCLWTPY